MPHTMGLSVWLMPARNNTSATSRHTQRFLWIVVRSDCKKEEENHTVTTLTQSSLEQISVANCKCVDRT